MERQTTVAIVGGGAAGLSAALFLSRAGVAVEVFDQDRSILKRAQLNNLPGVDQIEGRALLAQLRGAIATRNVATTAAKVDDVVPAAKSTGSTESNGFVIHCGDDTISARYVILAAGQGTLKLASLPVETTDARQPFVKVNVVTDKWGATSVPGVWAAGVLAGWPSQAVVCAGSGANVAVEICSAINGEFWVDHDDTTIAADPE
jgi:thioredoxin reductase (NADPH)